MDAGSPGRQQQRTTAVVLDSSRSPVRSAGLGGSCKRTPQEQLAIRVSGGSTADFLVCNRCGQISHNFSRCDFCLRDIPPTATAKARSVCPKRRLNLDGAVAISSSSSSSQPEEVEAKLSKRIFYGASAVPPPSSNHSVLTMRQPPAASTNGQAATRPLFSAVARPQLGAAKRTVGGPAPLRRGKREPECLTISISSDEEAETEGREERHRPPSEGEGEAPAKENHAREKAPQQAVVQETPPQSPRGGAVATVAAASRGGSSSAAAADASMRFSCRSIRIGSYKVATGTHWVTVSARGFEFAIRPPSAAEEGSSSPAEVGVQLGNTDVVQVLGHLARNMGVLFVTTTRECSSRVRAKLGMASRKMPCYFDPQGTEECQKRITFLPEPPFSEDQKGFLRTVFPGLLLHEIKQTQANEILIRSSPSPAVLSSPAATAATVNTFCSSGSQSETAGQSITHVMIHSIPSSMARTTRSAAAAAAAASGQGSSQENNTAGPNLKLLVYPPPPRTGGIAVHSADLRCLREGQFLNDVIIDFYLKYLVLERLSEEVRQRTHVFSSFFYPRLTQRLNRGLGPAGLSPAARRHRNVRTWTRHVDIFSKDFIVVPINQNAHWFLAVVCFPGLVARTCPPQELAADPSEDSPPGPRTPPPQEASPEEGEGILDSDPDDGTELEEPEPAKGVAEAATTERAYILILDSLRGGQGGKCRIMTMLREYLSEEWKAKKRTQLTFCYGNMRGYTPRTPQQGNYSDCGVYLLQYVESFLESPPRVGEPVCQERSNWFPETRVAHKRTAIRDLILELHVQQHPASDFPQRWRLQEEEEEAAAAQCLQLDDLAPTSSTTTLLVTPVPANAVILVCPSQPPS